MREIHVTYVKEPAPGITWAPRPDVDTDWIQREETFEIEDDYDLEDVAGFLKLVGPAHGQIEHLVDEDGQPRVAHDVESDGELCFLIDKRVVSEFHL